MSSLDLKIPPPAAALLVALAMWLLSKALPPLDVSDAARRGLALAIAIAGLGVDLAAVVSFRRARTTVNPMRPANAQALVTSGIYRLSRNPMYVGLALFLSAWAVLLALPAALIGPVVLVAYLNRFQIAPEEKVLSAKFGAVYDAYRQRVRRWL